MKYKYFTKSVISERGQALVTLLFFSVIGLTVTSAAVVMMLVNSTSGMRLQEGEAAYQVAQSGAENGMLRLLRNPLYTGENDLQIGSGSADIVVSGNGQPGTPFTIRSTGSVGQYIRKVEIQATYVNNLLQVQSQREVY